MAAEQLLAGRLPIGATRRESELLLQQTHEALQAGLDVRGVFDLRPALEAAAAGGILNARQLEGVAASMEAAFELRAAACATAAEHAATDAVSTKAQQRQRQQHQQRRQQQQGQHPQQQQQQHQHPEQQQQQQLRGQGPLYPCLADLAAGIQDRELVTLRAVRSCIGDGVVLSEASPELAAVREARAANRLAARELATRIARELHAQGAAEGRDAMLLRGRYCVAVKRSRRSAVSKGSVKLGESGTGSTLYLEPVEVLELNNREAQLADEERQAELAVLQALSQFLAERGPAIEGMLAAVTALDIVAARAKHAQWCGGVRPLFLNDTTTTTTTITTISSSSSDAAGGPAAAAKVAAAAAGPLFLPGARHPLLLQPSLPPLPRPPSSDDASFATDFVPPPFFAFAAAVSSSSSSSDSEDDEGAAGDGSSPAGQQGLATRTAKPLELLVPGFARVVAITGPNTGGKTVTLKTAGLLALMAKAGLFVPCDGPAAAQLSPSPAAAPAAAAAVSGDGGSSGSGSGSGSIEALQRDGGRGPQQPALLWFDQVLAEIGDSQSLEQNLSTFSGHIARLKLLLGAAGPASLVLLDEVGSGTDPLEGSALARAVLDVLAGQARLTLATSHHAELKTAADEDSRYVNVSLDFNTRTLQPMYALRWGSAGSSNALDIAQALGFDARVLAEARILARAELGRQEQQQGRMEQVAASVEDQLGAARASLAALTAARQAKEQEALALQAKYEQLLTLRRKFRASEKLVPREAAEDVLRIQNAARRFRAGGSGASLEDVAAAFDAVAAKVGRAPLAADGSSGSGGGGIKAGDLVVVPAMSAVSPFYGRVAKVVGESVYLEGDSNPLLLNKRARAFRLDEVVPAELVNVPVAAGLGEKGQLASSHQQQEGTASAAAQ